MSAPLIVNRWILIAHPAFLDPVDRLAKQVATLREKDPDNYRQRSATQRLAAIAKLILETIPQDPTRHAYRQGGTLGSEHTHWFRAKFFQQYRLFFRYHAQSKIIVYAWVNDAVTKRAYESRDDAYQVFRKMLIRGHPPNDWAKLLTEASAASDRFTRIASSVTPTSEPD